MVSAQDGAAAVAALGLSWHSCLLSLFYCKLLPSHSAWVPATVSRAALPGSTKESHFVFRGICHWHMNPVVCTGNLVDFPFSPCIQERKRLLPSVKRKASGHWSWNYLGRFMFSTHALKWGRKAHEKRFYELYWNQKFWSTVKHFCQLLDTAGFSPILLLETDCFGKCRMSLECLTSNTMTIYDLNKSLEIFLF